ncbi:type II secretion system minor pseudopilin GspK [Cupriavidus pauculus]|uniref:type II secretion system minor pseudopilin GspK n=1 Tax=Cupriavidus pauculus TaxID=82633 RepID=UPI002155877C|nr:type II secretion system minor pseudopilin GspK [Cupriavidus pauculus]
MPTHSLSRHTRRQQGAAVVTALLMVTLAVVVVSGMLWRQQVQIRSIENQRLVAQAAWIERAAVDWSRLILRDDRRRSQVDYLGEPWSVPVAETRLSDFLGAGVSTAEGGETSFVSGRILDAQARFNLTNLYNIEQANGAGRMVSINGVSLQAFRRLLQTLGMNPGLAEPTVRYFVRAARGVPSDGQPAPRPPDSVEDLLAIPGYTPAMVAALESFVTVLPQRTAVNANTADAEVLSAVIDQLPLDRARELVRQRDRAYFNNISDVTTQLHGIAPQATIDNDTIDVLTHYFLIYGLVRHERARRLKVSLVYRSDGFGGGNNTRIIWTRDADAMPEQR